MACKNTNIIARLEEKLYNEYPNYKDYHTYLTVNGIVVKRFKTLEENGIITSNNTRYERSALTAAHKNLPYGTKIKVTNLNNGRSVYLTITDHNMPDGDYIIKLSEKAASELAASDNDEFSIDIIKWG